MQIEREILALRGQVGENALVRQLRGQVKAADEEFHIALAFHEAWKPAAYDQALHERIGWSYAANTFRVIAAALRREMLLALIRLWDSDPRSVRMRAVGESLQNSEV